MKSLLATLCLLSVLTACGGRVGNLPAVNPKAALAPPKASDRAELDRCRKMIDSSSYRTIALSFAKIRIECHLSEAEVESLANDLDSSNR